MLTSKYFHYITKGYQSQSNSIKYRFHKRSPSKHERIYPSPFVIASTLSEFLSVLNGVNAAVASYCKADNKSDEAQ